MQKQPNNAKSCFFSQATEATFPMQVTFCSAECFRRCRSIQTVVSSEHRRRGLATMLLRALIAQGERENYYSIVAKVASDLTAANSFYERNGFATSLLKQGGQSRNRTINIRVHQLATPNLLSLMVAPPATKIDIQPRKRSFEALSMQSISMFFLMPLERADHDQV
jgi:hypothetical protein